MPHVLFVQGGGEGAHDDWDDRLVDSLRRGLGPTYEIRYPRMPRESEPSYARWRAVLARELRKLDAGAVLVGHSIGGTILINTLADEPPAIALRGVFLVAAPFVGDGGWPSDDIGPMAGLGLRLPARTPVHIYHGRADATAPVEHADLYASAIPQAVVRRLEGRDHQLNDDLSEVAADILSLADR